MNLDPETSGHVKDPLIIFYHKASDIDPELNEVVNIPLTHNKFNALEVVVEDIEDFDESSLDKEFVDATQLMNDDSNFIENSSMVNNEKFM